MTEPINKTAFCECCMQKGESKVFVGRTIRVRNERPTHFRLCVSCNNVSDEDFYLSLTRKLMRRILEQKQQEERALSAFKYRFFGFQ